VRLHFKRRALNHLTQIHDYIAKENPAAAKRVIERIEDAIGRLSMLPMSGRPGVVKGTRLLAVPGAPYIVVHRIRADTVEILAVLHTARQRRN
jgi:addiction module RelE/StbE family toxin